MEEARILVGRSNADPGAVVDEAKRQFDSLAMECPEIPQRFLRKYRPEHHT